MTTQDNSLREEFDQMLSMAMYGKPTQELDAGQAWKFVKLTEKIKNPILDWHQKRLDEAVVEAYKLAILGHCPECNMPVKDWEAPVGSFAPEAWATLSENGVDPSTGHKEDCKLNHLKESRGKS